MDRVLGLLSCCLAVSWSVPVLAQARLPVSWPDDPLKAVAAMPVVPAERDGVWVRVEHADGTPAPDAVVLATDSTAPEYALVRAAAELRFPGDEPRIVAARAMSGVRYAVDGRGATRLPKGLSGRFVAVAGDLLASVIREPTMTAAEREAPVTLRLLPAESLRVEVAEADGGAAARVAVEIVNGPGEFAFPQARTGTDGAVVFRLLPGRPASAFVRLAVATKAMRSRLLTTAGGCWRVTLPVCGSIRASFGGDLLPGSLITWELVGPERFVGAPSTTAGAAVRFDHVEVGFHGQLRCQCESGPTWVATIEPVEGAGETWLEVRAPAPTVAVLLRDPEGRPLRRTQVEIRWGGTTGRASATLTTNQEGWMEIRREYHTSGATTLHLAVFAATEAALRGAVASVSLEAATAGCERRDDVRVTLLPVVLRAVVVDEAGQPVPGLRLFFAGDHGGVFAALADGSVTVRMPGPPPTEFCWRPLDDGWFVANPTGAAATVAATSDPVPLVVRRAARIRFAARGLPATVGSDFRCELQPAEASGPIVPCRVAFGTSVLNVPAGHWNFVVFSGEQEVWRIDDVWADAGVETHDARFLDFAWQRFASLLTVRVEDSLGRPTDDCVVLCLRRPCWSGGVPRNGVFHWLVGREGVPVKVEPRGRRGETVELGVVVGEQRVRLWHGGGWLW